MNRINERIPAYKVVLILPDGSNKGQTLKSEALAMARNLGLDLVEVSDGQIPTCKILDFGKMQYEKNKREKKHNHAPNLKEMRLKFNIGEHDLDIKKRKINEFLSDGHKVVISMKLSGREKYVGQGMVAKDKFVAIVREFNPSVNPKDIKDGGNGFSYLVSPSDKTK